MVKRITLALLVLFASGQMMAYDNEGFNRLAPDSEGGRLQFASDGLLTHTVFDYDRFVRRHSYNWFNLNLNYRIEGQYWLSGLFTLQKTSFSNPISKVPYNLNFFGQFRFKGHPSELVLLAPPASSSHEVELVAGYLPDYSFGRGLVYSDFTSLGGLVYYRQKYFEIEISGLGWGYAAGDEVRALMVYGPNRLFGIGAMLEFDAPLGDRVIPTINMGFRLLDSLEIYAEGAAAYVFNNSNNAFVFFTGTYEQAEEEIINEFLSREQLNHGFAPGKESLAGLAGIAADFSWPGLWGLKLDLVNEIRYYGREFTRFYLVASYQGFEYLSDLTVDQRNNNQPSNFYLYRGETYGAYLKQAVEVNPVWKFFVNARVESLLLQARSENILGRVSNRKYGNVTARAGMLLRPGQNLEMGIQFSNVLIGPVELFNLNTTTASFTERRRPLLLENYHGLIIDFYVYYRFAGSTMKNQQG